MYPSRIGRLFRVEGERPFIIHVHYGRDQAILAKAIKKAEELGCEILKVFLDMDEGGSCARLVVDLKGVKLSEFHEALRVILKS